MSRLSPYRTPLTQVPPDVCQGSAHKGLPGSRCRPVDIKTQPIQDSHDPGAARCVSGFSPQGLPGSRCRPVDVKTQPMQDSQDQGCRPVYGSFPHRCSPAFFLSISLFLLFFLLSNLQTFKFSNFWLQKYQNSMLSKSNTHHLITELSNISVCFHKTPLFLGIPHS
jgi:hypothetical protein